MSRLQALVGERWGQYIDANGCITPEGLALLEQDQEREASERQEWISSRIRKFADDAALAIQDAEKSVGTDAASAAAGRFFDGSSTVPSLAAEGVTVGLGAAAGITILHAFTLGQAATALGAQAMSAGSQAMSLAVQAEAAAAAAETAAAAGEFAQAAQYAQGAQLASQQAQQAEALSTSYETQALRSGDKALKVLKLARWLTGIAGGVAVADGLWDMYKGIAGLGVLSRSNEFIVIGGIKISTGIAMLSSLALASAVAPMVTLPASAVYLGVSVYQNREAIAAFIQRIAQAIAMAAPQLPMPLPAGASDR